MQTSLTSPVLPGTIGRTIYYNQSIDTHAIICIFNTYTYLVVKLLNTHRISSYKLEKQAVAFTANTKKTLARIAV